jgi:hypothetical protein
MKKKGWLTGLLIMSIAVCTAAIADLTGKWSGELVTPTYNFTLTYNFKVDGEKLTGTVEGPGGAVNIDSGAIKNNAFRFVITTPQGDKLPTTGKFYGDSTTVDFPIDGQNFHIKLLRDK